MNIVEMKSYGRPETFFKNLVGADEAAALIRISTERLLELAQTNICPNVKIDSETFFIKRDLADWAREHFIQLSQGKSFTKPLVVTVRENQSPIEHKVPKCLLSICQHLKQIENYWSPCVYFLIKEKEVVYVGQSINIGGRLVQHFQSKDFDTVLYLEVPRNELSETEGAFIRALKPKLNGHGPVSPEWKNIVAKYGLNEGGENECT